jgi:hypothetical protein
MIKIKHIVTWEQLTKKPFDTLNLEDVDDLMTLLYVISEERYPYTIFKNVCKDKFVNERVKEVERELKYVSQFYADGDEKQKDEEHKPMTKIIGELIYSGVHPGWLMEQGIETLGWIQDSYNDHTKQQAEWQRFWTTLQLSPYIDEKNKDKPLFEFDWEKNTRKKENVITEEEAAIARCLFGKHN